MAQPTYLDPELQGLEREKQLAQAIQQRGLQPVQGVDTGKYFVKPAWTQYMASLYDAYSGGQRVAEAEKKIAAEQARQQGLAQTNIANALRLATGAPEQTTYGAGEEGPTKTVTPAVAGDKRAALAALLRPNATPFEQEMAKETYKQMNKEPKWEKDTRYINGKEMHGWTNVNDPTLPFQAGTEKPALSQKDIMQGQFEGWYKPQGGVVGQPSSAAVAPSSGMPSGTPLAQPAGSPVARPQGQFTPQGAIAMPNMPPQAAIQAGKEIYVDKAKRQAEYAEQAPANLAMMDQTIQNINDLIGDTKVVNGKIVYGQKTPHAGFEQSVGFGSAPLAKYIPGSDVSDFRQRFDQIKGQAFLQAFNSLKGGGQITEVEGAKATNALNRMSLAQSEKEFITAAREFEENVNKGMELARKRAGIPTPNTGWRLK